jgi:hypothetical protein
LRKAVLVVVVVGVIVGVDVVLANIPGPVPTSQAIHNVEGSQSLEGLVGNGSYSYAGFSDDPSWSLRCVGSMLDQVHFFDPFHEYTTTTLIFAVQPNITHPATYPHPANNLPFLVLVQVNPSTGEIYGVQTEVICA